MNLLISAITQIIFLLIIPFVWWAITDRKQSSFFNWIGLKKIRIKSKRKYIISFSLMILLSLIPVFIVFPLFVNANATDIATSQFEGQGVHALIPALIWSFLQTGLSEELFFRGFLTKRLINKFGFQIGNGIQGLLFGLMHGIFFIEIVGVVETIIIILLTGISGWLMGWINEKQSNGSIISSWILHGCGNIIASIAVMFNLI
ncbi:CPBP family intramembrane metalloprotease [Sedimentibacter sp. zth1]|uniref:CPBP family intramembrane glutamic endopeptidase n=1 Tax=Sedimentibacter sp. zth1 TaxID=2816908 RepID=UPI001A91A539|nr:CPBP family intramembrane glutamic endopeptidase [Sedimentibacter sp. zth1]QSX05672.1 CPBP family intramembrane metalloprotease [Sedimentibacter sp. zth1]